MANKLAVIINGKEYVSKEALKASDSIKDMVKVVDVQSKAMATAFSAAKIALVGIGVAAGAVMAIAGKALKEAADMQTTSTSFEVLIGDAKKAKAVLADLRNFAAKTPLQFVDITKSAQSLMAFGSVAEQVKDQISMLGDIAMGNASKLETLTKAYGKIQATGKVTMEEINSITQAGVPIIEQLAKQYGITNAELIKLVSTGTVGFGEVNKAFISMTSSGGKFYGMLEKQSGTFNGMVSTLKDNLSLLLTKLGESILPTATKILGDALESLDKFLTSDKLDAFALKLAIFAAQTYEVFSNVGLLIKALYDDIRNYVENLFKFDLQALSRTYLTNLIRENIPASMQGAWANEPEPLATNIEKAMQTLTTDLSRIAEDVTKTWNEAKEATKLASNNTPKELVVAGAKTAAEVLASILPLKINRQLSSLGSSANVQGGLAASMGLIVPKWSTQEQQNAKDYIRPKMADQAISQYIGSGLSDLIATPLLALRGFTDALIPTIGALSSVNSLLNPLTTIFGAMMDTLGPIITDVLAPLNGILKVVGVLLGNVLGGAVRMLTPIIELVGQGFVWLYNNVLRHIGNGLIIIFNSISWAVAHLVNGISWAIKFITFGLVDLGKVAVPSVKGGMMQAIDLGTLYQQGGASGTSYTGGGTGSSTSIQSVNITIYQNFDGPVIGEGGMEAVGGFIVRAIQAYSGVGGNVQIVGVA